MKIFPRPVIVILQGVGKMPNMYKSMTWILFIIFVLLFQFLGCDKRIGPGSNQVQEESLHIANNLPFQFPLKEIRIITAFDSFEGAFANKHHIAEDYYADAGIPVYSIADGVVSFSGKMGGYGWLIIIDHPKHDVYSLYGHLSKKRWKIKKRELVKKGENIAYIADDDEDGSGGGYPEWGPHLHFGIRKGKMADYPSQYSEERWMAGYSSKPADELNWLEPTKFINSFLK